jgi:hypothetical protein
MARCPRSEQSSSGLPGAAIVEIPQERSEVRAPAFLVWLAVLRREVGSPVGFRRGELSGLPRAESEWRQVLHGVRDASGAALPELRSVARGRSEVLR